MLVLSRLVALLIRALLAAGSFGRENLGWLLGPAAALLRWAGRAIDGASRVLTPLRGLLAVAIGCALLLGLSQFADYRGVAIGADSYDGVSTVAPAPEVEREELGTAHGYAMVPVALVVIGLLLIAARTRRWQICRLVALVGIVVVAVGLFVDRPAGLDEGLAAERFVDAEAQLLGGWWLQLFAGISLAAVSILLGREIRQAGRTTARAAAPGRPGDRRERPRASRLASPAGGAGA